jgi:adenylosuccinate synthase
MKADIVIGAQYGDEAKGKIAHHLCKTGGYTHVIRFNGGCNAGHTIYHNGKKFVTHHIPCGVFYGIPSIIGPGCVIDPKRFFNEIQELEDAGIPAEALVMIAKNAHVITNSHREEDEKDEKIGTTKRGNGPAYRDKYARKGVRAETMPQFEDYLVDVYEELHSSPNAKILLEGAQGFGLDIDHGDYPYVTSSHCTSASALLSGIPPQSVSKIWGVAKIYETYVGAKKFESDEEIFKIIRSIGKEYGATTGRPRQCNWLNWDFLEKSVKMNGVTDLVLNKMDVLRQINKWSLIHNDKKITFDTEAKMKKWIVQKANLLPTVSNVYFSGDPNGL